MKEDRARDAALATQEYEAKKRAVLANAERLRALRLAKEATVEAPVIAKKEAPVKANKEAPVKAKKTAKKER